MGFLIGLILRTGNWVTATKQDLKAKLSGFLLVPPVPVLYGVNCSQSRACGKCGLSGLLSILVEQEGNCIVKMGIWVIKCSIKFKNHLCEP